MNDRGYGKTVLLLWRSHNNDQVVHAPIIHVAGAVTDTDETYGAYVAAENNTFNNTSNSSSEKNVKRQGKINVLAPMTISSNEIA